MKKIISNVLIVFLLCFCFNITNVFAYKSAKECRQPGTDGCVCSTFGLDNCEHEIIDGKRTNVTHYDSQGNICGVTSNGQCGIAANGSTVNGEEVSGNSEGELPDFLDKQKTVSCGKISKIPDYIPFISSLTITVFTIISMGMLVVMGTVDLFRGINSGKPEDMKKCQSAFFSRLGSAVFLFFIVALTKLLVGFFLSITGGNNGIFDCINCFINNSCK